MTTRAVAASIRTRVRADGSPVFDVRYRVDGKSKSTSFTEERAANDFARHVRVRGPEDALRSLHHDVTIDAPTVDEYAETYILSKSGVEPKTLDHYRMFMRESISPAFGNLPITTITPEHVAAWVNAQANETRTLANGKTAPVRREDDQEPSRVPRRHVRTRTRPWRDPEVPLSRDPHAED
jgi:integrase